MGVRSCKKFLSALVDTASKNLDKTTHHRSHLPSWCAKAATVRNTQVTLSGKTPIELAIGRRPKDLMDPASMNPEQLTSTPTKQDLLNKVLELLVKAQEQESQACCDVPDGYYQNSKQKCHYRMHNVKRLPTGPHTPWPNRADMGARLFEKFLSALVDTASKNLDQTTLSQVTPAQLTRKAATVRNTQVTLSGEKHVELVMGRRPRDLMDPASMNSEQLTSTPTKPDLLNEEIQKLAMKTHFEDRQREDIRRDLPEGMKCVPNDLRVGEQVFYWQDDPSKIQQGRKSEKWLKVEIIAVEDPMVVINTGTSHFSGKCQQATETVGHSGSGRTSWFVWANRSTCVMAFLWGPNRCVGAVLGHFPFECHTWSNGLMVAAPVDLGTKKSEGLSSQVLQGFWSKININITKIVVMSPTVFSECTNQKEVIWQHHRLCLAIEEYQILGGKHFLILGPESGKIWWLKTVQYLQKKYHCQWTLLRRRQPEWIFHNFGDLLQPLEFVPISRERVVPTEWQVRSLLGDCLWKIAD